MGFSQHDYNVMAARLGKKQAQEISEHFGESPREAVIHRQIKEYCHSQWPRWKFIHARMDAASTIAIGAPDFTIFMPNGKTLCIECKRKGGKLSAEQTVWAFEMGRIGHKIHLVTTMEQFLQITQKENQ